MKRTTNRRLYSSRVKRGVTDVVEYHSPILGVVKTITRLELNLMGDPHGRERLAVKQMEGWCNPLVAVVAANQLEGG